VPLLLRRSDFSQPDYSVLCRDADGQEYDVGRIYFSVAMSTDTARRWWWGVYGPYRKSRQPPYEGLAQSLIEARAAFRRCWDSEIPS
jgi:hypothetical protein